MLGSLFSEEDTDYAASQQDSTIKGLAVPALPRSPCGFAGINNQGATCYLNSLIQTLLLTSEFREALFQIGEDELGCLEDKDKPNSKVRVIPIQLQRLFVRLLLSNRQSVSTVELTESFGWTNNEELQQHDVQELNRILFSAIEDSLVGTTGQSLIKQLYHGKVVNQITCMSCDNVSEREEDFLDLTLAVSGNSGLEKGLQNTYCDVEIMDGPNQYKCGKCKKLVDAKKGAKIRCLPPVLTISLLRFSFDYKKMTRFKETEKFIFPLEVDVAPYLEKAHSSDVTMYELFSVVIHRGGCYGGHYHAYIRDTECLGTWIKPEETAIRIPTDPSTGQVDFIELDSPVALLQAVLSRNNDGLTVDKLCAEITKQTGVSWNKRFKKQFGPIAKFLKKYDDIFDFNPTVNFVSLKSMDITKQTMQASALQVSSEQYDTDVRDMLNLDDNESRQNNKNEKLVVNGPESELKEHSKPRETYRKPRVPSPPPEDGHCWFNFDDSRVKPIKQSDIERQFAGSESAYMLFYKRKSLKMPVEAKANQSYGVPDRLINLILMEQEELQKQRDEYEIAVNKITVQVHFSAAYEFKDGALKCIPDVLPFMEISIDRRKSVTELQVLISELGGVVPKYFCIHRMKEVASGFHLYEEITESPASILKDLNIGNSSKLFLWDGNTVQDQPIPVGPELEPILLTVIYGNPHYISSGFAKCLSLSEFKKHISEKINMPYSEIVMKRLVGKVETCLLPFLIDDEDKSLEELNLKDGDQIFLESAQNKKLSSAKIVAKSSKLRLSVENRCQECGDDLKWQNANLEVDSDSTVAELKVVAMSHFGLWDIEGGGRLRIEEQTVGLRPPLHEEQTIYEARLTGKSSIILERGRSPQSNQITVTFTPGNPSSDLSDLEVIVDRNLTVAECMLLMIEKAQFSGDDWHLRKTNWCGEAVDILDDADATLDQCNIHDGEHLLLEEGRLPAKGFLRLPVWLCPSIESEQNSGMLARVTAGIQGLMGMSSSEKNSKDANPISLGNIEVSKESTLEDLKLLIMTLPRVEELPIPTQGYLRLRLMENQRLTRVLKGHSQSLQRLKLNSSCQIAVQILQFEENLQQNQIVLNIKQRIVDSRTYSPSEEVIFDTSKGSTPAHLRQCLADLLLLPVEHVVIAKHFPQRFEWLVIENIQNKQEHRKGKKGKQQKTNVKNAPFFLQDGDIIGVKNLQNDAENRDNFSTEEDDNGKEQLRLLEEEKRRQRQERKNLQLEFGIPPPRRKEVGLSIKVDNFT